MKKYFTTQEDMMRAYLKAPSLMHRLPWRDYHTEHQCFLLEDNQSLGIIFRLTPIACEARPESMMEEIAKAIQGALKNAIPNEKENPWILQAYIQKKSDLSSTLKAIEDYFPENRKTTALTQDFLSHIRDHLSWVSQPTGIFQDTQVTDLPFRGGIIEVYLTLYHRYTSKKAKDKSLSRQQHVESMQRVSQKLADQLRACGIGIEHLDGNAFYQWLVEWFNPKRSAIPDFPNEDEKPLGFDFTEQLFFSAPTSFEKGWLFDGMPHQLMTIQSMTMNPEIGHISGERKRRVDNKVFNLMDHLPEGSIFVINIAFQAPSVAALHLKTIQASAVGRHAQADKVKQEIMMAEKAIADGDALLPVTMGVYLKGNCLEDLQSKVAQAEILLNSNGFKVITDDELFPIDAYLRYLPHCYDFHFDQHQAHRSRYILLSDITKLLPFYGRSRGTGHPGLLLFNRGGEPWMMDVMKDKTKNAHLLILGETGTGKSNLLNYMIAHDLALYGSRFFIIDAGGSFDLLGEYCQSLNLSVNRIKIDPAHPISLNPFSEGLRILDQLHPLTPQHQERFAQTTCEQWFQEERDNLKAEHLVDEPPESRDILGDMVLAALLMITGGEKREEESIRRRDRLLIMDAIIEAAYTVKARSDKQMIASDIVDAFERVATKLNVTTDYEKIKRLREMADSMRYFTQDPLSSCFFNSYGNPWPEVDVTIIDFGLFAKEGYEAHRAIAFSGCMNAIMALAESNQPHNRAIKVVLDENHLFTSIPLLADIQTRIAKMGRKLGLWLWLATQNMRDFAEGARRMLSQIETWICLSLPPDEINQIEPFRPMSIEQRTLFLSARKQKGKYTEGVVLGSFIKALFRYVPPQFYLEMAATDQDEKFKRAQLMKEIGCSAIEAVKIMAKQKMGIPLCGK